MIYDLIIIGAGPAGMMAAGRAGERGKKVLLLDKNHILGKKLLVTGNNRCNVTNNSCLKEVIGKIVSNGKFLYHALGSFSNKDVIQFFEKRGVPLKIEMNNKVFPVSNSSKDIIEALKNYLYEGKVEIKLNSSVERIEKNEKNMKTVFLENGDEFTSENILLSTGGLSYPATGSTGDGYYFAKYFGHTIIPLKPSLVSIILDDENIKILQGASLSSTGISLYVENKKMHEINGDMIFTDFGVSGPAIFEISSLIRKYADSVMKISFDLKPEYIREKLDLKFQKEFVIHSKKQIKSYLEKYFSTKLAFGICYFADINLMKVCAEIKKEERKKLLNTIKNFNFEILDTKPIEEAVITSGGILVKEINSKTMESKLVQGLYFAGEVVDVDALTGGFNLQIAWSTGWLVGESV